MHWLQDQIDERTDWLLDHKMRKITPRPGLAGLPGAHRRGGLLLRHRRHPAQQKEFNACNRDVVARGRAPGIIAVEATQRPSADIIPTVPAGPVRLPVGVPLLHRSLLRHDPRATAGPTKGYSADRHRPAGPRVSWLRAEDGIPRRVKAAYLTDEQIINLADWAAALRRQATASNAADHQRRQCGAAARR